MLLDVDVLYPIRVCDFMLTASSLRLLARPVVSDMILEEAQRNVAADRPDLGVQRIERRFANVRSTTDGHGQAIDCIDPLDSVTTPAEDGSLRPSAGEWYGRRDLCGGTRHP